MADAVHLSQAAFDRLQAEHIDLTTRGRVEIARKIEVAREQGDLSENGDYHAAKEEQGKMEGRIAHLAKLLHEAEIVDNEGGGTVATGSVVTIRDEFGTAQYLLGSIEEQHDDLDVISPGSPLGQALLGHQAGDKVDYEAPTGEKTVELVAVE